MTLSKFQNMLNSISSVPRGTPATAAGSARKPQSIWANMASMKKGKC